MPLHDLPLIFLTRRLAGDVLAGEALFFPEVLALDDRPHPLRAALRTLAKQLLSETAPLELHRRLAGATPEVSSLTVTLEPPVPSAAWTQPVTLRLDVLRWRHGDEASIAYVPALGIEVVAARDPQLDEVLPRHIQMALARTKAAQRLFDLVQLARVESTSVDREVVPVDVKTPAQIAADDSERDEAAKPVIDDVGTVLTDARTPPAYEVDTVVDRLAEALLGARGRSVLLVGPSGVGKTAAFGELFRQRARHRLAAAPFWSTSGARLIAGMAGFGLWQERCQKLCRQAKAAGAIVHLGNLVELMEVGKAGGSQFGIAQFFRPFLARGDVWAVAECTPEQLPMIERANPHLLAAFTMLPVDEPPSRAAKLIMRSAALEFAARAARDTDATARSSDATPIADDAVDTLDRLHRRYATYSASPGRPLRFLRNLLQDRTGQSPFSAALSPHRPITAADVTAAFSRETGLPALLLDDDAPLDLAAAREHFASRVIGQAEAVDRVTDLLATVKAALNRPRRPIASLLFIGPTGVGKTEMAKAIAEFFFGDATAGRLVRFDMSEYATPGAVARLAGTAWDSQGLLTSKIREQPFCVLLLDEFEKAHPAFFDLLLQVLGEGRLTDAGGRLADFSNAIVVMTSNLGAGAFGSGPFGLARGAGPAGGDAADHFTGAVRDFLRPELFNRIDRVVPFVPLDRATIRQIAAREVELIRRRDGVRRRDLTLDVTPAALDELARTGYDPLYGARPLKRRVEQDLLAPLADAANQYAAATALHAAVDVADGRLTITVRARVAESQRRADAGDRGAAVHATSLNFYAARAAAARRRAQAIARCPAALSVANELFTLRKFLARMTARNTSAAHLAIDPAQRERLKRLEAISDGIGELTGGLTRIEDALLLGLYESAPLPMPVGEVERTLAALAADAQAILLSLFTLGHDRPHAISVGLYGNAPAALFVLARAYRDVALRPFAEEPGHAAPSCAVAYYTRPGRAAPGHVTVAEKDADTFLSEPRAGILGIVLSIRAPFARARFEAEAGLHVIEEERNKSPHPILVDASPASAADYHPPKDVEFRIALAGQRRRTYTLDRHEADDSAIGKVYRWTGRSIADALGTAIEEHLTRRVDAILAE